MGQGRREWSRGGPRDQSQKSGGTRPKKLPRFVPDGCPPQFQIRSGATGQFLVYCMFFYSRCPPRAQPFVKVGEGTYHPCPMESAPVSLICQSQNSLRTIQVHLCALLSCSILLFTLTFFLLLGRNKTEIKMEMKYIGLLKHCDGSTPAVASGHLHTLGGGFRGGRAASTPSFGRRTDAVTHGTPDM